MSYAQLDDQESAVEQVAELLKPDPEITVRKWLQDTPYLDEGAEGQFLEGARKAKLPETSAQP